MKKIIKNLLMGFCIGVTVVSFSIIISEMWGGDFDEGFLSSVRLWLLLSSWCGLSIGIGMIIGEKNKSNSNFKIKILKFLLVFIFLILMLLVTFLVISIINNFGMIVIGFILSMIVATLVWALGAYLGLKSMKKDCSSDKK